MRAYLELVMVLNFLVDLVLLAAANRFAGLPKAPMRCVAAALVGAIYAGLCMLPELAFLGGALWRVVSLVLISLAAFGIQRRTFRAGALFVVMTMALGGIAMGVGEREYLYVALGALALSVMCTVPFAPDGGGQLYAEVELWFGQRHVKLLALRDTGNRLTDPITGQSVLVTDAAAAMTLLRLTQEQLRHPVETVASGHIPGLRLIPYRAVGQSCGMLVAVRLDRVRIGEWEGSRLVAFAPEGLGEEGTYRALTGGYA